MDKVKKIAIFSGVGIVAIIAIFVYFKYFFTEEAQNKISRKITSTLGVTGMVEVYNGGNVMKRFLKVDKLSTAYGTDDNQARPYRYGYGFNDKNLNGVLDDNEKNRGKIYFEFSEYSQYLFLENK
jgi:hypothetical protein